MYDVLVNARRVTYSHKAAVLDACWGADHNRCFSGGVDRAVKTFDFTSSTDSVVGAYNLLLARMRRAVGVLCPG